MQTANGDIHYLLDRIEELEPTSSSPTINSTEGQQLAPSATSSSLSDSQVQLEDGITLPVRTTRSESAALKAQLIDLQQHLAEQVQELETQFHEQAQQHAHHIIHLELQHARQVQDLEAQLARYELESLEQRQQHAQEVQVLEQQVLRSAQQVEYLQDQDLQHLQQVASLEAALEEQIRRRDHLALLGIRHAEEARQYAVALRDARQQSAAPQRARRHANTIYSGLPPAARGGGMPARPRGADSPAQSASWVQGESRGDVSGTQ